MTGRNWPEPTVPVPSYDEVISQLEAAVMDRQVHFETSDGCELEPDGVCQHGHPTWLVRAGLI
jgi:hypothetical protein